MQQLGIQWYDITHVSRYSNSLWIAQHYLLFMSLPGEWRSSDNDVRANEDAVDSLVRATAGHQCGSVDASSRMTHAIQCREHFEYVAM